MNVDSLEICPQQSSPRDTHRAAADRFRDMLVLDTLHLSPEVLAKIVATAAPKTMVFSHMAERAIPIFPRYDAKRAAELAGKTGVKVVVATEGMPLLSAWRLTLTLYF